MAGGGAKVLDKALCEKLLILLTEVLQFEVESEVNFC